MLPDMAISAGDTLTVVFNGTEYICECADVDGSLAFGNWGAVQEEPTDTGEPFIVMHTWFDESTKVWVAMALDGSATFTLSVMGEVHHTVPEKYLPHRVADVNFSVTTTANGNVVWESDMSYLDIKALAKTPNTEVRGVIKAENSLQYLDLYALEDASEVDVGRICFVRYQFYAYEIQFFRVYVRSDGRVEAAYASVALK